MPPVPVEAVAVSVPPKVTLMSLPAPVAPMAAPAALAVNVRLPAVTADVLSVMLPVIARRSSALATTFTVPNPMPLASVINALPLVVVIAKLSTLKFNALAAVEPIPVESAIVSVVAVMSVVVSSPAASVIVDVLVSVMLFAPACNPVTVIAAP